MRLGPLEGKESPCDGTASLPELIVLVVVAMALLTGLDWLGAGHHSTGAAIAPTTSAGSSHQSSAKAGAKPSRRIAYVDTCGRCRVRP